MSNWRLLYHFLRCRSFCKNKRLASIPKKPNQKPPTWNGSLLPAYCGESGQSYYLPDQNEVEIQCLSSTESVISSSASPVQIQYRIQWENSVWGVLVQCTEGHITVVGQCQASREAVYKQCLISMSEIFKWGGSREPVYYCISTDMPYMGWLYSVDPVGPTGTTDLPLLLQ